VRARCKGHARHWFAPHGVPGVRLPKCIRCGAPNSKPLTTDDWWWLVSVQPNLKTHMGEPMIEDVQAVRESLEGLRHD